MKRKNNKLIKNICSLGLLELKLIIIEDKDNLKDFSKYWILGLIEIEI